MKRLIILLLYPSLLFSQEAFTDSIQRYMTAQAKVNDFNGVVLVMKARKVVVRKAYGFADREWNVRNTMDTKFRIGSMTKQFTAACILQLQEQGKLSVQDKLSKYIPDYPKGDSITIHMLLNHTSGIQNYTEFPEFWQGMSTAAPAADTIISLFKNKPLDFAPGTRWSYSNSGYILLGYIIEKSSGEKYADYVRNHLLQPAGMNNSGVDRLDSVLNHRARGYSKDATGYKNTPYISMESAFSAGSIYSTVEDLYKWDRALNTSSVLSDSSRHQMLSAYKNHYGYGMFIDTVFDHYCTWHGGYINGFLSKISRFPKDDICIVVLSNNESDALSINDCIAAILFNKEVVAPYVHKEIHIDSTTIAQYRGDYEDVQKHRLTFYSKEGKLYTGKRGGREVQLKAESATKFFYADDSDRQIEFIKDNSGKITSIWKIENGLKTAFHKL